MVNILAHQKIDDAVTSRRKAFLISTLRENTLRDGAYLSVGATEPARHACDDVAPRSNRQQPAAFGVDAGAHSPTFHPHGNVPFARRRHITVSFRSYIPGIK